MKRASSASKSKSAAAVAKRKPRRRLALAGAQPAPVEGKPVAKSKPVAKRKPVAKPRTIAKRKAPPTAHPPAETTSAGRRTPAKKSPVRRSRVKIPAYLLEGDTPATAAMTGPGEKFALGPGMPAAHGAAEAAYLPEAYGSGRLYVTPRDPHWLYVHWDITPQQQFRHNARSVDRHLILRIHEGELCTRPAAEIHVHPESRYWFAHVERTETVYVTELGYYQKDRRWKSLATAAPAKTPAHQISTDATVEFATIPLELPFETMLALLAERGGAGPGKAQPLARAIESLRTRRDREFPAPGRMAEWTPEQERALAEFFAANQPRAISAGSQAICGLLRGHPEGESWSSGSGEFDRSSLWSGQNISSPPGGGENVGQSFWFNVNAELIIYGATQPDASVTIGGKQIALRPDGSFGFRFALPDGQYELALTARSADGTDGRAAKLRFTRATELRGDVGAHPQDPTLNLPTSDAV